MDRIKKLGSWKRKRPERKKMDIKLEPKHLWTKGKKPFGLSEYDTGMWNAYTIKLPDEKINVWTSVPVGHVEWTGTKEQEFMKEAWIEANQKKIDVVIESETEITIMEIRQHAGVEVISTLWNYDRLFKETYKTEKPTKLLIITNFTYRETQIMAEREGIQIIEV